ncbi:MAG: ComEA family DNA-binding protein [Acidimicrobiia bacterium]
MLTLGVWWWTSIPPDDADTSTGQPATDDVVIGGSSSPTIVEGSGGTAELLVHVAGEVRTPGVVRLEDGARVVDAIEAAGGATEDAVLAGVNLAAEVSDGSQVVVPSRHAPAERSPDGDGLVAINTATAAELEALPGVGPVLAGRIVAHREAAGGFDAAEDLLDVSGIGESILARLRPLVRVP